MYTMVTIYLLSRNNESLWPTVRLCAKCWKVRVQDKQICAECEAKGLSPDSKPVDVSYPNINHVVVKEA